MFERFAGTCRGVDSGTGVALGRGASLTGDKPGRGEWEIPDCPGSE
jgi:hypothetical protein